MAPSTSETKRRGLSREAVVERALALGEAEGLEAVSLRRLATDLGVTPMALYRHVRDKQDLVNAMTEVVLEGLDLTLGFKPSMTWQDKLRRALTNFKEQIQQRPLALPLSIAYSGDGPLSFWRTNEVLLGILLDAGFKRRQAVVLIRAVSNLVSGYLLLMRHGGPEVWEAVLGDPHQVKLLRKRFELTQLSLPRDQFPHSVDSAREFADVWLSDPNLWWGDTVDLLIFGLEGLLGRSSRKLSAR